MNEDFTPLNEFDSESDPFFDGLSFYQPHSKLSRLPILPFSFSPECFEIPPTSRSSHKPTIYNQGLPTRGSPKSLAIAGRTTELRRLKVRHSVGEDSSEEDFPEFTTFVSGLRRRRAKRRKRKVTDREGIANRTSELRKAKTPKSFAHETEEEFIERILAESGLPTSQNQRISFGEEEEIQERPQMERSTKVELPKVICVWNDRTDRFRELRVGFPLPSSFQKKKPKLRRHAETVASRLRVEVSRQKMADWLNGVN
jgi:hypothetical protein